MKILIAVVVAAIIAGLVVFEFVLQNPPIPGAVVPVAMPEDAMQLEVGTSPIDVLRSTGGMIATPEDVAEAADSPFIGMWIPKFGWNGEVKKIRVADDGSSAVTLDFGDITLPGFHFVIAELPGGHPEFVVEGGSARVFGRIAAIELVDDPLIKPNRIIIRPAELTK